MRLDSTILPNAGQLIVYAGNDILEIDLCWKLQLEYSQILWLVIV